MKMFKLHLVSILFLSLLLGSCIKDVPDKYVPKAEPKLVVFSFITPSSPNLKALVYKSTPILGGGNDIARNEPVVNATVTISNSKGELVELPFSYDNYCFLATPQNFPIVEGESYTITVSAAGFKTAYATTTVPTVPLNANNVSIKKISNPLRTDFSFDLLDGDVEHENYYRYIVFGVFDYPDGVHYQEFSVENYLNIASDKTWNSNKLRLQFIAEKTEFTRYEMVILGLNREYFRYYKTRSSYDESNPFAEASPIYSNITNGIGVFAAYKHRILKFDAQGNLTGSSTTSSAVLNEINHYAIGNK